MTQHIDERMIRARSRVVREQPFWGTLVMYLTLVEDESVETMATDGVNLFYAPSFLDTITDLETEGVVAHEGGHCVKLDHVRMALMEAKLGAAFDPDLWNEACDYSLNPILKAAGFTLPHGHLDNPAFYGMCAEEIYDRLAATQQSKKAQGQPGRQGQPGAPSGAGSGPAQPSAQGQPQPGPGAGGSTLPPTVPGPATAPGWGAGKGPGAMGKVLPAAKPGAPDLTAEQEAAWRSRAEVALGVAGKSAGGLSGELEELAKQIRASSIDWRNEMAAFFDSKAITDQTWTVPNRRFIGSGMILPGTIVEAIDKLGVIIDVSGSITVDQVGRGLNEVRNAVEMGAVNETIILQTDTKVQKVDRFTFDIGDLVIKGRGGTHFAAALEWFAQNEPDVAALLFFTDLETTGWGVDPGVPVLWVSTNYKSRTDELAKKVPFGTVIQMGD